MAGGGSGDVLTHYGEIARVELKDAGTMMAAGTEEGIGMGTKFAQNHRQIGLGVHQGFRKRFVPNSEPLLNQLLP